MSSLRCSASNDDALNVIYLFSSDIEEDHQMQRFPGSAGVQESLSAAPGVEDPEDDMSTGTSPPQYRKRLDRVTMGDAEDRGETSYPRKSARLREKRVLYVRTSVSGRASPLAKRPRLASWTYPNPGSKKSTPDITYISSGSDSEEPPETQNKLQRPRRQPPRTFMESVVIPLHARNVTAECTMNATQAATGPSRKHARPQHEHEHTGAAGTVGSAVLGGKAAQQQMPIEPENQPKTPPWLQAAIADLQTHDPGLKLQVFYRDIRGNRQWGVKCLDCDQDRVICAGPGHTLYNLVTHLNGVAHCTKAHRDPTWRPFEHTRSRKGGKARTVKGPVSKPSAGVPHGISASHTGKSTASRRAPASAKKRKDVVVPPPDDPVERLLKDMGLSTEFARALRRVGISDEARIKALGRLPDVVLDRLERSLAEEGLDLSACLLVREGLKQRATAA